MGGVCDESEMRYNGCSRTTELNRRPFSLSIQPDCLRETKLWEARFCGGRGSKDRGRGKMHASPKGRWEGQKI